MAGKSERPRARPSIQPGGRPPAPGGLALVQAFINSHYDLEREHGADLLATPERARAWLRDHGLGGEDDQIGERARRRLVALREALRELARANGNGERARFEALNHAIRGAPVEVRFGPAGPRLVAAGTGPSAAIGLLAALAARSMLDGSWSRLKVCPGVDCGWAFYDHSRNQAGRWCSMSVCGGRAKARAHYSRARVRQTVL
jgi:predicted RNA-binding Zn ribbon-like protein